MCWNALQSIGKKLGFIHGIIFKDTTGKWCFWSCLVADDNNSVQFVREFASNDFALNLKSRIVFLLVLAETSPPFLYQKVFH